MPNVSVWVDGQDVLEEMDDDDIVREIERRRKNGKWRGTVTPDAPDQAWGPIGMAEDLRTAFYARNASRFEAILRELERHEDGAALHPKLAA